jgi:hypothetical protein
MTRTFTNTLRAAAGVLVGAALFGCDGAMTLPQPEANETTFNVVSERVSLSEKERALRGEGDIGGRTPMVSQMNYAVQQIPYQAGPRNLANTVAVGDDVVENVPLGFNFQFYGNTYSTVQVSSNGFLRFNPANTNSGCCSGRVIPLNDTWNNIIAFAWVDLVPTGGTSGTLRYETRGAAPNRQFILHVDSVRIFGNPVPNRNVSQWVILNEGSNTVEIHTEFLTPQTQAITQGLENADGTEAHFVEGRVATVFSLQNDAVRFTPLATTIDVDIHRIYSGNPPRMGDTINLGDPWVYVEILDPLQYRPGGTSSGVQPFQSANQVRIGPSYDAGVPAESFQLLDINNDGRLDFRGRWSRQALQDAGRLPVGTSTLRVWGDDNGQRYRGERQVTVVLAGGLLFQNCGVITHPNGGTGAIAGQNVSMSSPAPLNVAGLNTRQIPGEQFFRSAESFTIPAGATWQISSIITHAYETGQANPTWSGFNANIWNGVPGEQGSSIIGTTTSASTSFIGVYRTFNGVLNDANRPIHRIVWNLPNVSLPAGTYWVDWQVQGGASGWAPPCMQPDPQGGNNTVTVVGNARQFTDIGWQPTFATERPGQPGAFPIAVLGTTTGGQRLPAANLADHGTPVTAGASVSRATPNTSRADTPR